MPAHTSYSHSPSTRENSPYFFQTLISAPKSHLNPKAGQQLQELAARLGSCHGLSSHGPGSRCIHGSLAELSGRRSLYLCTILPA